MSSNRFLTCCCEKYLIEGEIGGKRGKFALVAVLNGFYYILGDMSSTWFLTGSCEKKNCHREGNLHRWLVKKSHRGANSGEKEDVCPSLRGRGQ